MIFLISLFENVVNEARVGSLSLFLLDFCSLFYVSSEIPGNRGIMTVAEFFNYEGFLFPLFFLLSFFSFFLFSFFRSRVIGNLIRGRFG